MDIEEISTEEVIDRYVKGLKQYIPNELFIETHDSLTTLMSHAFRMEASKSLLSRMLSTHSYPANTVPMDISNAWARFTEKEKIDYENWAWLVVIDEVVLGLLSRNERMGMI